MTAKNKADNASAGGGAQVSEQELIAWGYSYQRDYFGNAEWETIIPRLLAAARELNRLTASDHIVDANKMVPAPDAHAEDVGPDVMLDLTYGWFCQICGGKYGKTESEVPHHKRCPAQPASPPAPAARAVHPRPWRVEVNGGWAGIRDADHDLVIGSDGERVPELEMIVAIVNAQDPGAATGGEDLASAQDSARKDFI